jgi:Mg2+ and Co2+ transporter CorA
MQLLTFVTVVLGTLAVVAGVLGMNFNAPLFDTGTAGFWTTVGAMAGFVLLAMLVARWRGWWK